MRELNKCNTFIVSILSFDGFFAILLMFCETKCSCKQNKGLRIKDGYFFVYNMNRNLFMAHIGKLNNVYGYDIILVDQHACNNASGCTLDV